MTDTAPALTDEQIDVHLRAIRECYDGDADAVIAAVIARAKREAAEEIAAELEARLTGDKHGCLRHGVDCPACRALDRAIDYVKEATQ